MYTFIKGIADVFQQHRDAERAASAKAYLRNQFEFLGLPSPLRRALSKAYVQHHSLPPYESLPAIVTTLYTLPEREFHYFGIELIPLYKKQWTVDLITLIEKLVVTNSWWDTVDFIAPVLAGGYFKLFPGNKEQITGVWNRSENFWLQRSSLLFQKNYKKEMDTNLLSAYILHLSSSKEFFIQKAIGWVLREFARTDPDWVNRFVLNHHLAPLSRREALKHLSSSPKD